MKYIILIIVLIMVGCTTMPVSKDPRGLNGLVVADQTGENMLVIKYEGNNYYRLWKVQQNGNIYISE